MRPTDKKQKEEKGYGQVKFTFPEPRQTDGSAAAAGGPPALVERV